MKIMHLLESPRFSGAENVVCQIIGMLSDNIEYKLIYCSRDGQIREALCEREIQFAPIKELSVREVRRVIRENKPDIIHAHDMKASYIAARACGNVKLICHIHNNSFDSRGLSMKALGFMIAAQKAKHIFYVSDSSYKGYFFHKLFERKSEVLYNIIDIDLLIEKMNLDKNKYNYDIVYLGRLTTPKNPKRLLKVIEGVVNRLPDTKIAIIGTGDLEEEVRNEVDALKLNKNIYFLGFQNNPYKILHDSKLMLMTSLWEGTPMCVLEAMSLGVPIVSTPTDGVHYIVEDGQTGILSDSNIGLVDACCKIISDAKLREEMSVLSKQRAQVMMEKSSYVKCIVNAYECD